MKKSKSTGLFSGLPQKAKVLGAQFIRTGQKQSFQITYYHNGLTYVQSISEKGDAL
jgi:hypothetical protein